ncbi:NAD-dependent epimerase/dehydratase family protein [Sphingobacterium thalpophilum]|uniref:NAD-dependent epimerase/dehydratase family protein n=1 Tax=Sphingobacterium thalpophilum TaxID=259 RepID=UPI003D96F6D7
MKLVTIAGGQGFVGQHLLRSLEQQGFSVESLSLRKAGWKHEFNSNTKVIINLVGKAHDHKNLAKEEDYYYANVELAKQIFDLFIQSSADLFIHVSSIAALEEYQSSKPLVESNECRPESWYGKSKREAEKWLVEQEVPVNKKIVILRPPMIHGSGDKGNLGLFYTLISKGIPYPLASFHNKRTFIAIDNFCFFIEQIIRNKTRIKSKLYHVADNESISTNEIIEVIKSVTGKRTPNLPLPQFLVKAFAKLGDVFPIPLNSKRLKKMTNDLLVSNEKIKNELNINELPITALEGIQKTIKSFL